MAYLIAAAICAVPLLALCFTGKLYRRRCLKLKGLRSSERLVEFSAYLMLYIFFAFFCWKAT